MWSTSRILIPLLLALAIPYQLHAAGPAPVNLLSTANFVILSGAGITTTGGGIINGNIGASPIAGSAIGVTCAQVNGTIYAVDASGPPCAVVNPSLLTQAKSDLTTAYNDAAGRTIPTATNPGGGNLGGLSLAPGLYKITTTTLITGSDLTLAGGPNDVWIFQCGQDLQLGSGIKVILTGGAQAQNVFWSVATSAVLGTSSVFNGTILAQQSVTMDTSSTINGRALAFTAGVTFNGNGATLPNNTIGTNATGIAVQQPLGTNLTNGIGTSDFGSVAVWNRTNLTFIITNTGTADLTDLGVTIIGTNSTSFTVITNPASSLIPGGTTDFTVSFAPVSTNAITAELQIANNDIANNNNPFTIAITGTGTGTNVVPEIVIQQPVGTNLVNGSGTNSFGMTAVGTTNRLIFTIVNNGASNLTVSGISLGGANPASFIVSNLMATVSPGGRTNFIVLFAPINQGQATAILQIANNDNHNNPYNIALAGTGLDSAAIASTNISVVAAGAGILPTALGLDPQTGLYTNSVLLTNNSSSITVPAIRLYVLNLLTNVQVYYGSATPSGTPYVQYNYPLAPAATVDFTIEYHQASRQGIPIPTYVPQDATPVTLTPTNGVGIMVTNFGPVNGGFLIGFYAAPGRTYALQYGTNTTNWLTATPFIIAPANYVQWIDYGAPKTQVPGASRYYQAVQLT